jgi:hypothetical protein
LYDNVYYLRDSTSDLRYRIIFIFIVAGLTGFCCFCDSVN